VRVVGAVVIVIAGAGAAVPFVVGFIPEPKSTPQQAAIGKANSLCNSLWGYHPVALQPKGMVFTFVDLGPRLIAVTHHEAVTGPYHRNGQQKTEEHTSELQSLAYLVCRLLLEKKNKCGSTEGADVLGASPPAR